MGGWPVSGHRVSRGTCGAGGVGPFLVCDRPWEALASSMTPGSCLTILKGPSAKSEDPSS